MTATSLQFGPEWMRNKHSNSVGAATGGAKGPILSSSPPVNNNLNTTSMNTNAGAAGGGAGASTYSSLLSSSTELHNQNAMNTSNVQAVGGTGNPFKYSKEEMLQVWRDGGGRGALGLEVEMWEGVVKEIGGDPIGLKEMTEGEKKLFSLPLNSELRRRQSNSEFLQMERPKLNHAATTNLGQARFSLLGRKRKEDGGVDVGPPLSVPRRLSLTSLNSPLGTPLSPTGGALPSPRTRIASGSSLADGTPDSWRKREPALPEEREEGGDAAADPNGSFTSSDASRSVSGRSMAPSPPSVRGDDHGLGAPSENLATAMSVLSVLDEDKQRTEASLNTVTMPMKSGMDGLYKKEVPVSRPPGLEDPENISWSYMDPTGNVQGPFTATIMQKWYEEGYFTPDLLMKRTNIDPDWTPVGELVLRADHEKLFFSTFVERGPPPGLGNRPANQHLMDGMHGYDRYGGSLQGTPQHIPDQFGGSPFRQPRGPLDSYLGTPTSVSGSPFGTGMLGGGHTASPDLAYRNAAFSPGVNGFDTQPSPLVNRTSQFGYGNEAPYVPRLANLRTGFDNQGYNGFNVAPSSPWGTPSMNAEYDAFGNVRTPLNNGLFGGAGFAAQDAFGQESYGGSAGFGQHLQSVDAFGSTQAIRPMGVEMDNGVQTGFNEQASMVGAFGNNVEQQAGQAFGAPQQVQQQQRIPQGQGSAYQSPALQNAQHVGNVANVPAGSPWDAPQDAPQPRPRPFDPPHPSSRNLVTTPAKTEVPASEAITQATAWAEPPQSEAAAEPTEPVETPAPEVKKAWNTPPQVSPKSTEAEPTLATSPVVPAAQPSTKKQVKAEAVPPAKAPTPAPAPQPAPAPKVFPVAPAPAPASTKPAWGGVPISDETTTKPTLREIQEAEAKKAEARKLAEQKEREKERAARAAAATSAADEVHTLSWGLPTSQAGAVRATPREQTASSPVSAAAASAPVWANGAKPLVVKKTMKEIQEEEERKKKAAQKEKEMAAVAARRGYAESANKHVAPQPPASGGAWTTVGVGGKTAAPIRPAPAAQPAAATPRPVNGVTAARPAATPTLSATQVPKLPALVKQPPQLDDGTPPPPSPELMKWLRDHMRDFNPGFNTEEFLQMILSFSLDFPPAIIDLIAESVYANSSTMHGRNFATEFATRRKADAAKTKSLGATAKMPSLADVVRTQPKPVQAEMPFKVVKKKGRK